ncbi:MAG: tRNA pseudouridine(38-40) synthase TruA [Bacteroidales bacterium]|jgi:tRNA pseudouridine38-40 synthase|nr:tRNA pseudouridine(38-40) synthase TruA [Bacteroidales bacterium]
MRYFLHLNYNGADFFGWQVQKNKPSVEQTIEKALSLLLNCDIDITGCGRTDTGVNARNFYAHFDHAELDKTGLQTLIRRLNAFLPQSIRIFDIFKVRDDAHARFDAVSRTYSYHVRTAKNPFDSFSLYFPYSLDTAKMNEAAALLLHYTDFTSFAKVNSQTKTNLCQITQAQWQQNGEQIVFLITANRFLRNMVRAIVGTLLDVGKGKMSLDEFEAVIKAKNRCKAGTSVKPNALFLEQITYPSSVFLQ